MKLTPEILQSAYETLTIPEDKLENPILIQMVGGPSWGKTFLSDRIAGVVPVVRISSDRLRKKLFPQAEFTEEENRFLFDQVCETLIKELAQNGHSIILDMNVARKFHRTKNCELANSLGMRCLTVLTKCSDKTAKRRMQERQKNPWRLIQRNEYIVPVERYDYFVKELELPGLFEKKFKFNSEKDETKKFKKLIAYLKNNA